MSSNERERRSITRISEQEREKKVEQKQELDLDYKRMNYCDAQIPSGSKSTEAY